MQAQTPDQSLDRRGTGGWAEVLLTDAHEVAPGGDLMGVGEQHLRPASRAAAVHGLVWSLWLHAFTILSLIHI